MLQKFRVLVAIILSVVIASSPLPAMAAGMSLIRDTEIENTIRDYATPLFAAAGLQPDNIRIFIVNGDDINAFVAGGQNLFLNSGLLVRSDNPNQIMGVIAHETGHIAGGHLARLQDELRRASIAQILSMVLGAVAVAASGQGEAGMGVMVGGSEMARRVLLQYNRNQEQAADQAGVKYLDEIGQSSRGMVEILEKLSGQEMLLASRQSPYVRSHPLTSERMNFVRNHLANSPYADAPPPEGFPMRHKRMVAKLHGFMQQPGKTLMDYPASDTSLPARYARAIAYYRIPDLNRAVPAIDALIADHPDDPYFRELKGQMLYENGRVAEAQKAYAEAIERLPDAPLVRAAHAETLLALNKEDDTRWALAELQESVRQQPENSRAWRQLAIAHGRLGDTGLAALALAEEALLTGQRQTARQQARRAQAQLPTGSPGWLRAEDIETTTRRDAER
ncbi:MAG: M48 family metalloprotease [Oceanibaculum nanhaiense]|uniref:M48 family metalloprotease n=1 Tax=Oceanibaculum nanhaiense TaxID=1909734 RepID=UPI0025A31E63|nr:M48 family metalloprotease [Oceanibaculum nanhaiense]MDM7947160.1 M48 family metalloprotease [Oceanibaculum nanhaiense]